MRYLASRVSPIMGCSRGSRRHDSNRQIGAFVLLRLAESGPSDPAARLRWKPSGNSGPWHGGRAGRCWLAVNNIVMATPDINAADFGEVSGVPRSFAARTAIYSSSREMALVVSKEFHSYPRLGGSPAAQHYPGIDRVDASAIKPGPVGAFVFWRLRDRDSRSVLVDEAGIRPGGAVAAARPLGAQRYWVVLNEWPPLP